MPNTLFITPGPVEWASSRMRAHWVAKHLDADVIEYSNPDIPSFEDCKNIVLVKVTPDGEIVRKMKADGYRFFWDICDPVHWFNPTEAKAMAEAVDGIIASNQALADDFAAWSGKDVTVIKDRLNLDHFQIVKQHHVTNDPKLIWYGAFQNRNSLLGALATLMRLRANGINVQLTICDDRPEAPWNIAELPVYHTKWSLANENSVIGAHDVAILPPYPGPWGTVKSNNKYVTAFACGVPAVSGFDYADLHTLLTDHEYRAQVAQTGRKWVEAEYNVEKSAQEWKELIG